MSQSVTTNRISNFFNLLKQSLGGDQQDYTQGSIRKAVFLLAIPMILEMGMESVFALVDIYFVGHLPNASYAVQTVGLTESVLTIVYSLAIGISMAATAMVARRVGEKDPEGAANAAMQSLIVALVVTIVITTLGVIYAPDLLRLMGAQPETIKVGTTYTRIMMGGSTFIILLFIINGIFRGAGDASMAMQSLGLSNLCNIILCPLLIRGIGPFPELGLTGAAVATTIGRGIGVLFQLYHLFRGNKLLIKFKKRHVRTDLPVIKSLVGIASPAILQFVIGSCSWLFLARLVATTGQDDASAGYQIAIRVVMFFLLPAWGLSNAAATLVGQNLGAKQPERAEQSVLKTARYSAIFMGLVSLIFLFGAEYIISFFTTEPAIAGYSVNALRIICCGYIFYGIGMVMINAFNGAGDTWTPTWINLGGFWAFQIPLAYLLAKTFELGPLGVFIAIPVAETAITIASVILFRRGKWKHIKI
jgi:putative MATE family efflux protein